MKRTLLSAKNDFVFKLIFGSKNNSEILKNFLQSVLDLPKAEYEELYVSDTHLLKEREEDKMGILDVRVQTSSGYSIAVEIQVYRYQNMEERIAFYSSKMITEQIQPGDEYGKVKRVIIIMITDYTLTEQKKYHTCYRMRDEEGNAFSNTLEINVLELSKVPGISDGTGLWNWLMFLKAEREEDYLMLTQKDEHIKKAIEILTALSNDEVTRYQYEYREKARMDRIAMLRYAEQEGLERGMARGMEQGIEQGIEKGIEKGIEQGIEKGIKQGAHKSSIETARKALAMDIDIDTVMEITGLSQEEIEFLSSDLEK